MEIEWNKAINHNDDLTQFKWEIGLCISGEDCWCRTISVKDKYFPNDKETACIISSGSIGKLEAEHIVKIHNDWLDNKQKV